MKLMRGSGSRNRIVRTTARHGVLKRAALDSEEPCAGKHVLFGSDSE